ncbi:MAG: S1-like domain-containing RNA-binding protein [Chitinophagaceae bacterium]
MIKIGEYNDLKVVRIVEFGVYLDDGAEGILLPKRFTPEGLKIEDTVRVFLYHDGEDRLIATTQEVKGTLGEIVKMKTVNVTPQGAFMDWGLMKDLFVPKSKQLVGMRVGGEYMVQVYLDDRTGRLAGTEKFEQSISNENLDVKTLDPVDLLIYRKTEIGYVVIINNKYTGLLHFNEVYRDINIGDKINGFVKTIRPDNKIDVATGVSGYQRVDDASQKVLDLLSQNNGYLPYNDKSDPGAIYSFFGMSKKTFKMTTGKLFKQQKIIFTQTGIQLMLEE